MNSQCEYSNLIDFLIKHKAQENQTATHTRIGIYMEAPTLYQKKNCAPFMTSITNTYLWIKN
jgi:hypothetical protein